MLQFVFIRVELNEGTATVTGRLWPFGIGVCVWYTVAVYGICCKCIGWMSLVSKPIACY